MTIDPATNDWLVTIGYGFCRCMPLFPTPAESALVAEHFAHLTGAYTAGIVKYVGAHART